MFYTAYSAISPYACQKNYELIAGTKFDNIHAYYELIKVTAVGTAHNIKLILEVPPKTESALYFV
jgi:hypothetical protein